jgi:hypothetical protein
VSEKKHWLSGGALRAETKFEDIAEFGLGVSFNACGRLSCFVFDGRCGGVYCQPIFTWGFLLDEFAKGVVNPPFLFFDATKD